MTNPPQGSDEQGNDRWGSADERTDIGTSSVDPDRYATQPAPSVEPAPPAPTYGQPTPPYGQGPQYGQSRPYGEPQPQAYGQPQPYGQPAQPGYGQPQQQYGAPQYATGQYGVPGQPYGQPAAAPGEKSKVGLIALVTGIALLVIAGVVVLVMSLQSTVLDPAAVERDVAAQFEEREGVAVELNCADDMKVNANATYECSGTTADGESVTLQIAIADENSAAYTWTEP
jgi:hypothetical protein